MRRLDANAIDERPVGGTEIPKESLRRRDLKQAVMARKEPVVRKTELCVLASADHERVVLIKCENAPGLRPGDDVQCNAHQ
jgi:hypothetical protein